MKKIIVGVALLSTVSTFASAEDDLSRIILSPGQTVQVGDTSVSCEGDSTPAPGIMQIKILNAFYHNINATKAAESKCNGTVNFCSLVPTQLFHDPAYGEIKQFRVDYLCTINGKPIGPSRVAIQNPVRVNEPTILNCYQ